MMEEGAKLQNHLTEFNILMAQVFNAREKLKNKEKVFLLLRSLPNRYKLLIHIVLIEKKTLNLKNVTTILMENDRWLELKNN